MSICNIMRYPVLPEDEGRHEYIMACNNEEEAIQWVKSQKNQYFKPTDYYICVKLNLTFDT